jgi:hypothetical protein|tara:strand:- start:296 stop:634 length:339 start_codon:yes stop_codon:yes gene_type:complete
MDIKTNWTKEEFVAYTLIHASQTDCIICDEEIDYLESKFDSDIIKKMVKELDHDNDYQRLQKIMHFINHNKLTRIDLNNLLDEIKNVFESDGDFNPYQQNTFMYLKKILLLN